MASRPLIIIPLNSFAHGGVERVALRLARRWVAEGARVRVLVADGRGPLVAEAPPDSIILDLGTAEPRRSLGLAAAAARACAGETARLFAAGNTYALVAMLVRLRLGAAAPPIILKVSNDLARADMAAPLRWGYRRWLAWQGRMFDQFVGLAAPMRAEIAAAMHVAADRVTIIDDPALGAADMARLAAIAAAREPAAAAGAGRRYVGVGRLVPQKNFGRAIAAFAAVAAPQDSLVIVGDGPERGRLEAQVAALGLGDRVSLPGAGPAAPALAAADVFVLSSDYEALPAAVVEALASGLPVVATDCCVSMRALVGDFGSVVAGSDPVALGRAMVAQPALTPAQRAAAAAAMAAFTVERAAPRYLALLAAAVVADTDASPENAILARETPATL